MNISVCIATYNGHKYIEKQIVSILPQIQENDEIIIVDDCSTDFTVEIITKFNDSRIKILKNKKNLGVVKSFEICLKNANADIIFLCDQDDVWSPQKVKIFKQTFLENPDVTLVLSDAEIINEYDHLVSESFFKLRGKFTSGILSNIVKNKYHGCTMAFRKETLKLFLPFPDNIPMHDMWIGIMNSLYGKTFYIDRTLIQYRIHGENTGRGITNHSSIIQMLHWRLIILKCIMKSIL